jgi:hypothetical protein
MTIEINTDKTLKVDARQHDFFSTQISEELERFESHITRIEVHLKDENGEKKGLNAISCMFEARIEGRKPIAVTCQANTVELATMGAINKIKAAVETTIGRMQNH